MDISYDCPYRDDYTCLPTHNAKARRAIQAKRAWQKYQETETASVADTFRQKREKLTEQKLKS